MSYSLVATYTNLPFFSSICVYLSNAFVQIPNTRPDHPHKINVFLLLAIFHKSWGTFAALGKKIIYLCIYICLNKLFFYFYWKHFLHSSVSLTLKAEVKGEDWEGQGGWPYSFWVTACVVWWENQIVAVHNIISHYIRFMWYHIITASHNAGHIVQFYEAAMSFVSSQILALFWFGRQLPWGLMDCRHSRNERGKKKEEEYLGVEQSREGKRERVWSSLGSVALIYTWFRLPIIACIRWLPCVRSASPLLDRLSVDFNGVVREINSQRCSRFIGLHVCSRIFI